jgi:hypothetical protein
MLITYYLHHQTTNVIEYILGYRKPLNYTLEDEQKLLRNMQDVNDNIKIGITIGYIQPIM